MPARRHYAYHLRHRAYIEPDFGYTILEPSSLVDEAFARVDCLRDPSQRIYYPGTPSLARFLLAKRGVYPVRREKAVVSLRGGFDDNIYHIISDLLPRLALLDEQGVDPSIPIVIAPSPLLRTFVRVLEQHRGVVRRQWLVQDGFYVEADEVIFARADDAPSDYIDHVLNTDSSLVCAASPADRTLFIARPPGVGRDLSNMEEIVPILEQFDLEIVDPATMTIEQQIEVFSRARLIVGLHGAGLTNIVFRGHRPLRMLEILPPYRVPLCFYAIAKKYGFDYDCVVGTGASSGALGLKHSYALDPRLLRAKLERLYDNEPHR